MAAVSLRIVPRIVDGNYSNQLLSTEDCDTLLCLMVESDYSACRRAEGINLD